MQIFKQSPTDPSFVQNPYPAYDRARAMGDLVWWDDYQMPAAVSLPGGARAADQSQVWP